MRRAPCGYCGCAPYNRGTHPRRRARRLGAPVQELPSAYKPAPRTHGRLIAAPTRRIGGYAVGADSIRPRAGTTECVQTRSFVPSAASRSAGGRLRAPPAAEEASKKEWRNQGDWQAGFARADRAADSTEHVPALQECAEYCEKSEIFVSVPCCGY